MAPTTLRATAPTIGAGVAVPRGEKAPVALPGGVRERDFKVTPFEPLWAPLLMKWRWALIAGYLMIQLLAFNGEWRIGLDSAVYRHVGHSLATGQGYTLFGEPQRLVYPGLPMMLAGLERLFGESVWPAILVLQAMALAAIWLTWRLMSRVTAPWLAVLVTAGVAYNATLVRLSHELMTDVPFLLGVVMVLWGWETLRDRGTGQRIRSVAWILAGLVLCASMRPTFWVVAAALVVVCTAGALLELVRGRPVGSWMPRRGSWAFYGICLLVVALVGVGFLVLDPRTSPLNPLEGAYEAELAGRVMNIGNVVPQVPHRLVRVLHDHVVALFFAERVVGVNFLLSLLLLTGVAMVSLRRPLWGLLVALLMGAILLTDTEHRYWLMVLPILWLGWAWLSLRICARLPGTAVRRSAVAAVMLGLPIACHVGHSVKLILEQRSRPFLRSFANGDYEPVMATAEAIARHIPPDQTVIAPYSPVLSYASGRRVVEARQLFRGHRLSLGERARRVQESGAKYALFPLELYEVRSAQLLELGRAEILVPFNHDDSQVISIGWYDGVHWYLAPWAIEEAMIPTREAAAP